MTALPHDAPIATLRALSGLTQRQLAKRLGVAHTVPHAAEQRGAAVTVATLARYCEAAGFELVISVERSGGASHHAAMRKLIDAAGAFFELETDHHMSDEEVALCRAYSELPEELKA